MRILQQPLGLVGSHRWVWAKAGVMAKSKKAGICQPLAANIKKECRLTHKNKHPTIRLANKIPES